MFKSIIEFANQALVILILFLSIGLSAHFSHGYGTKKAREFMIGLLMSLMIIVQLYYLLQASLFIPASRFQVYNSNFIRQDCTDSSKGGKRPQDSSELQYRNPCFCHDKARCIDESTGRELNRLHCPIDGTAKCLAPNNYTLILPYILDSRNCKGGMGIYCSKDEPCYPCDRDRFRSFGSTRCGSCSTDFKGECNFTPDVGPYCFKKPGSKDVEPCKVCCTESTPIFVNNTCY